jgi:hypothetical protein
MANDRSPELWRHAVRYRITAAIDRVYVRREGKVLAAYLVARQHEDALELVEGYGDRLDVLTAEVIAGASKVIASTPPDSVVSRTVRSLSSRSWTEEDCAWMARPIADRVSWAELGAILYDSRGRRSDLDNF